MDFHFNMNSHINDLRMIGCSKPFFLEDLVKRQAEIESMVSRSAFLMIGGLGQLVKWLPKRFFLGT
jgi:hypothetical protein